MSNAQKFRDCVNAIRNDKTSETTHRDLDEVLKDFDQLYQTKLAAGMNPAEAALTAGRYLIEGKRNKLTTHKADMLRNRLAVNYNFEILDKLDKRADEAMRKWTGKPISRANRMVSLYRARIQGGNKNASFNSIEDISLALWRQALAGGRGAKLIAFQKMTFFGKVKNAHLSRAFIRHLDEDPAALKGLTAHEARAVADAVDAWRDIATFFHKKWTALGGDFEQRGKKYWPHDHDADRIAAVKFKEWRNFIVPLLDRTKIIDKETGKAISDEALEQGLRDMYDAITDVELDDGGMSLMEKRRATGHRWLQFKSEADWFDYQRTYGKDQLPLETMMDYMRNNTRDLALAEALGPDPRRAHINIKERILAEARKEGRKPATKIKNRLDNLDKVFDVYTGAALQPGNTNFAQAMRWQEAFLSLTQLGRASVLAVIGDPATRANQLHDTGVARFSGLFGRPFGYAKSYGHLLTTALGRQKYREAALYSGLINDAMIATVTKSMRSAVAEGDIPNRARDKFMHAGMNLFGLNQVTEAGRLSYVLENYVFLKANMHLNFNDLPADYILYLRRGGIDETDWANLGKAPMTPHEMSLPDLAALTGDKGRSAQKFIALVESETEWAVPKGNDKITQLATFGTRPGTPVGEYVRIATKYARFPISRALWAFMEVMNDPSAYHWRGWKRVAVHAAWLTALQTVGVNLREIAQGREPYSYTDPELWKRAVLMGGGFGLFGDQLRHWWDGRREETILNISGPLVNLGYDFKDAVLGDLGDKVQFIADYAPLMDTWWLTSAMWRDLELSVLDILDPDAAAKIRKKNKKRDDAKRRRANQGSRFLENIWDETTDLINP